MAGQNRWAGSNALCYVYIWIAKGSNALCYAFVCVGKNQNWNSKGGLVHLIEMFNRTYIYFKEGFIINGRNLDMLIPPVYVVDFMRYAFFNFDISCFSIF